MTITRAALPCALLVLAAGCGGNHPVASPSPTSTPTSSAPPTRATVSPETLVHQVALTRADLPAGYSGNQAQQGDQVAGEVTLDMCGATFPSEDLRIARHQVGFTLDAGSRISNEVVAYRPGGAAQALDEVKAAIASCPTGYASSNVAGVPDLRTLITPVPTQRSWQPGTVAFALHASAKDGQSEDVTMVLQPRGDIVSMLYVSGTKPLQLLDRISALLSERLRETQPERSS